MRLSVAEQQMLPEMYNQFLQPKGGQESGQLLIPRFFQMTDVHIQYPYGDRVPHQEAVENLL